MSYCLLKREVSFNDSHGSLVRLPVFFRPKCRGKVDFWNWEEIISSTPPLRYLRVKTNFPLRTSVQSVGSISSHSRSPRLPSGSRPCASKRGRRVLGSPMAVKWRMKPAMSSFSRQQRVQSAAAFNLAAEHRKVVSAGSVALHQNHRPQLPSPHRLNMVRIRPTVFPRAVQRHLPKALICRSSASPGSGNAVRAW